MKITAHLIGHGRIATTLIGLGVSPRSSYHFEAFVDKLIATRGIKGASLWLDSFSAVIGQEDFGDPKEATPVWVDRKAFPSLRKRAKRQLTKVKRALTELSLTLEQWTKFRTAVERPPYPQRPLERASALVSLGCSTLKQSSFRELDVDPLPLYIQKAAVKEGGSDESYSRALQRFLRDVNHVQSVGCKNPIVRRSIARFFGPSIVRNLLEPFVPLCPSDLTVGTVHVNQEPGCKARFFASPRLIYQNAGLSLKTWSFSSLNLVEEDFTYNQGAAIPFITAALEKGQTCWSVDLTNATDNFPLALQLTLLRSMRVPSAHIELLEHVSFGTWKLSEDIPYQDTIQWTGGQPLGFGPSFAVFSLTLHALIRGLATELGFQPWQGYPYCQLGDDLVFTNDRLAQAFLDTLESLSIPFSREKSITSNRKAEFAGFTVYKDQYFRPGKWRVASTDNFLDFIRQDGVDYHRILPKYMSKLIDKLYSLPYPYGLATPDLSTLDGAERSKIARHICTKLCSAPPDGEPSASWPQVRTIFYEKIGLYEAVQNTCPVELPTPDFWLGNKPVTIPHWLKSQSERDLWTEERRRKRSFNNAVQTLQMGSWAPPSRCDYKTDIKLLLYPFTMIVVPRFDDTDDYPSFEEDVAYHFASIIYTMIMTDLSVQDWMASTPFLRGALWNTSGDLTIWNLISFVVDSYPFFRMSSFEEVSVDLFALLKRVADGRDVIPSRLAPMPRRNEGVA